MGKQRLTGTICCRQQPCFTSMENKCPILVMLSEHTCGSRVRTAARRGRRGQCPLVDGREQDSLPEGKEEGRELVRLGVAGRLLSRPPEMPRARQAKFPCFPGFPQPACVCVLPRHSGRGNEVNPSGWLSRSARTTPPPPRRDQLSVYPRCPYLRAVIWEM